MLRTGDAKSITKVYGKGQDRYLDLVSRFPLRPIRSDWELDAAIEVIDSLLDLVKLSKAEADYLDVLSDLVEDYETETEPMDPVSDAEMVRYLIGIREVTQAKLAAATGIAVSTISEVLSGRRRLNRNQIGKLARFFHVEPGVFSFDG